MKRKIYVETTVISYLASRLSRDLVTAANQQITHDWWTSRRAEFQLFVSQLVIREASAGDNDASERRLEFLNDIPLLALGQEALHLAERY